jgi:UDP-2,4-diacetamido-2,4,6-trideoxy-beta-L-altropyranose hydrolase
MIKQKVILRADGNSQIGYGHVMRALALANMLKSDFECFFATTFVNEFLESEILSSCKEFILLPQNNSHFDFFLSIITGDEIVVLDNYFFSSEYQLKIKRKGCKLICIDDLADKHYYADLVINHAPGIKEEIFSAEKETKILTGLDFAILRKEFLLDNKSDLKTGNSIIICFGGADIYNITGAAIIALSSLSKICIINVIVSSSFNHLTELKRLAKRYDNIVIHQNISAKEIINLGLSSRLAITSASTVSYEMLSLGLNLVVGYYVDNQKNIYNGLIRYDSVIGIGNLLELSQDIKTVIKDILESDKRNLPAIDGKSGERILNAVKELV